MDFERFMKSNKKEKPHVMYAATKSLTDETGEPLLWELKPVTSEENDMVQDSCMVEAPVKGKPNQVRDKLKWSLYTSRLICMSVVCPDLMSTALQNSYGVATPEALLKAMVDDPGEYVELAKKVQEISGFKPISEDIEEAKN